MAAEKRPVVIRECCECCEWRCGDRRTESSWYSEWSNIGTYPNLLRRVWLDPRFSSYHWLWLTPLGIGPSWKKQCCRLYRSWETQWLPEVLNVTSWSVAGTVTLWHVAVVFFVYALIILVYLVWEVKPMQNQTWQLNPVLAPSSSAPSQILLNSTKHIQNYPNLFWLVVYLPLWKIRVRQLGWWLFQLFLEKIIQSCSSHHQAAIGSSLQILLTMVLVQHS